MKDSSVMRVAYYGPSDLSVGYCLERCAFLLRNSANITAVDINDAIEFHQCRLMVEGIPEAFSNLEKIDTKQSTQRLFSKSCKFVNQALHTASLSSLYKQVEPLYREKFWQLMEACAIENKIQPSNLAEFLQQYPHCLGDILKNKEWAAKFPNEIKLSLLCNRKIAAELIISRLAAESGAEQKIYLPDNLERTEIDEILLDYLNSGEANPNHISVIRNWPLRQSSIYKPSKEVLVCAKRRDEESTLALFSESNPRLRYGVSVTFDPNQKGCKGMKRDGFDLTHTFSTNWLERYLDYPTIMNNLIYVFDYVDSQGLLLMPSRKHEERGLIATLGMRAIGEYRETIGFHMRNDLALLETIAYTAFLESHDTRLENAIEWVYKEYFFEEYGIEGFTLALPAKTASWLDKCKAIGPEIERAAKAYSILSERGEIDGDYFRYESFKSFSELKSLSNEKYVIEGPGFERAGNLLCSDQCMLAYLKNSNEDYPCFYNLITKRKTARSEYDDYLQPSIDWLIENGFVSISKEDNVIWPTLRSACIKEIWDKGGLPIRRFNQDDLNLMRELADHGFITYSNGLFTPVESNYLNYMFNNSAFPNSRGLRNRYDHADSPISDPNSDDIKNDYYQLLTLLIGLTLKINEELSDKTEKGFVEDFVDWPYYDESIYRVAKELDEERQ